MAYVNNPAAAAAAATFVQPPTAAAPGHNPVAAANPQPNPQATASTAGAGAHGAHNHAAAAAAAAAGGAANSLALLNMSNLFNQKDSRWLQLEVCREFQRNKCSRSDCECKFAHPTSNVEVQNGRVTACYDSIKVKLFSTHFFDVHTHLRKNKLLRSSGSVFPVQLFLYMHNSIACCATFKAIRL